MSFSESIKKLFRAWGKVQVEIGKIFIRAGLENQGLMPKHKQMIVMSRPDIQQIFLEGFGMGRDTINPVHEEWFEENGLYHPYEAWLNSDSEELLPAEPLTAMEDSILGVRPGQGKPRIRMVNGVWGFTGSCFHPSTIWFVDRLNDNLRSSNMGFFNTNGTT